MPDRRALQTPRVKPWRQRGSQPLAPPKPATRTKPAARTTTVAIIRRAGIVRKHGRDRISWTNLNWETSMPIAEQLRHPRSQSSLPALLAATRRPPPAQSLDRRQALSCPPHQEASWWAVAARASRTTGEIATRFAICAGIAFPNLSLAILSRATAEFLAGCAAYGQALYCTPMMVDDHLESRDPEPAPAFSRDRAKKPLLILISERARGLGWPAAAEPERAQSGHDAQTRIVELTRPAQTVEAPSRWYRAVVAGMTALLSNILEVQARHQAIMELNALDDRALRDIGLSRFDIKSAVSREGVERCDPGPPR
jgi:uncharacterized protein YjiS (DUF1127 family)